MLSKRSSTFSLVSSSLSRFGTLNASRGPIFFITSLTLSRSICDEFAFGDRRQRLFRHSGKIRQHADHKGQIAFLDRIPDLNVVSDVDPGGRTRPTFFCRLSFGILVISPGGPKLILTRRPPMAVFLHSEVYHDVRY